MDTGSLVLVLGLLTLVNVITFLFNSLVCATIVYHRWRELSVMSGQLPKMLNDKISELAAQFVEPLAESLDQRGKRYAMPNRKEDEVVLEEGFDEWQDGMT